MNLDRLVTNRTPMRVTSVILDDRHGWERLVAIAKMTWAIVDGRAIIASPQRPVRTTSVPYDDARAIRYPSDVDPERPGTDVLVVGTAGVGAPASATKVDLVLEVSDQGSVRLRKHVELYGPRVWQRAARGIKPGPAQPVTPQPLQWEKAWGGYDDLDRQDVRVEVRNPIGTGVAADPLRLLGTPTPCFEDPEAPLGGAEPAPAGFGAIARGWAPRRDRLGTSDETWRHTRAPIEPEDFDPRSYHQVVDDQWCDPPLRGDETIRLVGFTPAPWKVQLPRYEPQFSAVVEDGTRVALATHLDTVLIDVDAAVIELVWRASVPLPRRVEAIRELRVLGSPPLSAELTADLARRLKEAAA